MTQIKYLILKSDVLLTGENISDAQPGFDSQTSEPAVHLRLDSRGSSIFKKQPGIILVKELQWF